MTELGDLIKVRDRKKKQLADAEAMIAKKEKSISNKRKTAISNAMLFMEKDLGIDAILILIDKYVESRKDRKTLGLPVETYAKPDNKTSVENKEIKHAN